MPSFAGKQEIGSQQNSAPDLHAIVRSHVRRELEAFLVQMEGLGRELGKSMDCFVSNVRDERCRLDRGASVDQPGNCSMSKPDIRPVVQEPVISYTHQHDIGDDFSRDELKTQSHDCFLESAHAITLLSEVDFSLPPLLADREDVCVQAQTKFENLTVSFDGVTERLTGKIELYLSWQDMLPGCSQALK